MDSGKQKGHYWRSFWATCGKTGRNSKWPPPSSFLCSFLRILHFRAHFVNLSRMVRVLLCHYFKAQRVFSESYQPTSLYASRKFIFVGVGGCRVFVHSLDLPNFPLVCQFSTISTAVKLVSSEAGNYVATIERRQQKDASTYARVYFNWDKASTNEAVRVVVAGYTLYQRNAQPSQQFLAVELPSRTSVTALACCKSTGNIVVACDGKLCIYRLCVNVFPEPEVDCPVSCDLEHLLDIDPGFVVRGIDICDHFVAFRSKLEVRTIRLVFSQKNKKPFERKKSLSNVKHACSSSSVGKCEAVVDDKCSLWEFDNAATAFPSAAIGQKQTLSSHTLSDDEVLFRTVRAESVYIDTFLEPKEVLGPVTEVKGHPLKVVFAGRFGVGISVESQVGNVHGSTMLYRRFRAEQLCLSDTGMGSLHSLQLLPTYAKGLTPSDQAMNSPLVPYLSQQHPQLCGMCVLVSGPKEGYMYDIFNNTSLISLYRYTSDTMKVTACHTLLQAITKAGLETYTIRMFAAASKSVRQYCDGNTGAKASDPERRQATLEKESGSSSSHAVTTTTESQTSTPERSTDTIVCIDDVFNDNSNPSMDSSDLLKSSESAEISNNLSSSKEHSIVSRVTHEGLGPLETARSSVEEEYPSLSLSSTSLSRQQHCPPKGWEVMLPTHELDCLRQLCPPPSLDVCLIGMYPFVGLSYCLCSDDNVILYSRATRGTTEGTSMLARTLHSDIQQPEWSIYILENMAPVQLYKSVMPLANRCQKHNPQAYHRLICEQHMFLKSCCLVESDGSREADTKKKRINKLLCESALNLADICSRFRSGEGPDAAEYYNMSGLPLWDVINRVWKAGPPYGEGMAHYLDQKLFGPDEPVIVSENIAKKIFKIYSKVKPIRVSEIVLTSSLSGFSPETAITALEDLKKTEHVSYRFTAIDKLVLAILYLHQCEPEHAQAELFSIDENELFRTVSANYFLLHEDLKHLTPLAQMLRKHKPGVFVNIVLYLHDNKLLSLDTILGLLGANKPDVYQTTQVMEFLEAVVNDKKRVDAFQAAVPLLSRIYLTRLMESSKIAQKSSNAQKAHKHVPEGDGHFGVRYQWLDKLPPFSGSLPAPQQDCPISRQTRAQSSPRTSRHVARPLPSLHPSASRMFGRSSPSTLYNVQHVPSGGGTGDCSCCCCTEYLLKLQSILCSPFATSVLCETLLNDIKSKDFIGDMSIKMLCYPRVGAHHKAISVMLEKWPALLLPYGQQYFGSDLDKWSHLLGVILEQFPHPHNIESDTIECKESRRALLGVLKGTLSVLAAITSPLTLLSLIPDEGAMGFFLPYLEKCYRRCASEKMSHKLTTGNVTTHARFYT